MPKTRADAESGGRHDERSPKRRKREGNNEEANAPNAVGTGQAFRWHMWLRPTAAILRTVAVLFVDDAIQTASAVSGLQRLADYHAALATKRAVKGRESAGPSDGAGAGPPAHTAAGPGTAAGGASPRDKSSDVESDGRTAHKEATAAAGGTARRGRKAPQARSETRKRHVQVAHNSVSETFYRALAAYISAFPNPQPADLATALRSLADESDAAAAAGASAGVAAAGPAVTTPHYVAQPPPAASSPPPSTAATSAGGAGPSGGHHDTTAAVAPATFTEAAAVLSALLLTHREIYVWTAHAHRYAQKRYARVVAKAPEGSVVRTHVDAGAMGSRGGMEGDSDLIVLMCCALSGPARAPNVKPGAAAPSAGVAAAAVLKKAKVKAATAKAAPSVEAMAPLVAAAASPEAAGVKAAPGETSEAAGDRQAPHSAAQQVAYPLGLLPRALSTSVERSQNCRSGRGRSQAGLFNAAAAAASTHVTPAPAPTGLWAAYLPAAALTVRPSSTSGPAGANAAFWSAAAVAGSLPVGPLLRDGASREEAAEAVDLALLALRGPFGTPLQRGLGAYGQDLELLLPARGSDLHDRLAAVRHFLAPTAAAATAAAGLHAASAGVPQRIRFGCGVCAACRDPLAQNPCVRPLTVLCLTPRIWHYNMVQRHEQALRAALGWDPVATYAAAARSVSSAGAGAGNGGCKRPRSLRVGAAEEDEQEQWADAEEQEPGREGGAAAVADTGLGADGRRKRARCGSAAVVSDTGVGVESDGDGGWGPERRVEDIPLSERLEQMLLLRRQAARRDQHQKRELSSLRQRKPVRAGFHIGAADGTVVVPAGGFPQAEALDGLVLDGERVASQGDLNTSYVMRLVRRARFVELERDEHYEIRSALAGARQPPVYYKHGDTTRRGHVMYGTEGQLHSLNAPAVAAAIGCRLPGWVGRLGPNRALPGWLHKLLYVEMPQAQVHAAEVVKAAGLDLVALDGPLAAERLRGCIWCGMAGHKSRCGCPLRRLCAPSLEPLWTQRNLLQREEQQQQHPAAEERHPAAAAAATAASPVPPSAGLLLSAALMPQNHIRMPTLSRVAHYYSSLPGAAGAVEPLLSVVDEPGEAQLPGRSGQFLGGWPTGRPAAALEGAAVEPGAGAGVAAGELPRQLFGAGRGAVPVWLASVDPPTLELMAALDQAHPWANGMQPVRRIISGGGGEAGGCDGSGAQGPLGAAAAAAPTPDPAPVPVPAPAGTEPAQAAHAAQAAAATAARWGFAAGPEPLSCEVLLMLALLMEESMRLQLEGEEASREGFKRE